MNQFDGSFFAFFRVFRGNTKIIFKDDVTFSRILSLKDIDPSISLVGKKMEVAGHIGEKLRHAQEQEKTVTQSAVFSPSFSV